LSPNVPALGDSSPGLPLGSLVLSVPPLGSQQLRVSPSSIDLPSIIDTTYGLSTPSLFDPPSTRLSPDFLPLGRSTVGPEVESPEVFFTTPELRKSAAKRLVTVARGFLKTKQLPDGPHGSFWSKWPPLFGPEPEVGSEIESTSFEAGYANRLCRLKEIDHEIRWNSLARRIWLICVDHEVEYISLWEGIDAYTAKGFGRRSVALNIVWKLLGMNEKEGKDLCKRSQNIVHLMKTGGPAAVLLDDGDRPHSV
jgi:hypothetical protein